MCGFSVAVTRLLVLAFMLFSLVGCQRFKAVMSDDDGVDYQPPALDYSQPAATSGGLFRTGHTGSLLQDKRALRVGDILTIVLDESTQSSKSAGTSYGKSSDVSVGVPTVFGSTMPDLESSLSSSRDFSGSAKSSQQNTLRGAIAVTVHQVMPNGTLLVKGEKALKLNQGDEYIRLSGLVRLEDINSNNQISSQNVANARISYAGRGALNDSNSAGWLTRFFTHPLFPL
jgi:flagellar L-ring protein precursor FlgH